MQKYLAFTALIVVAHAKACDLICAMIYSVDVNTCECVPIYGMECHPQYHNNCSQIDYDLEMGREWLNPYRSQDWYSGHPSISQEVGEIPEVQLKSVFEGVKIREVSFRSKR